MKRLISVPPVPSLPPVSSILLAGMLGALFWPAAAHARDNTVAVAHISFKGDLPEAAREIILRNLVDGLAEAQLQAKPHPQAARRDACADTNCFRGLANQLGVSYLVNARVEAVQRDYDIDLEIVNGHTGQTNGVHRQRCQICGIAEVGDRMSLAASALAKRIETLVKEPGRIVIRSHPQGALISLNGEIKGRAPIEVTLPAGRHKLTLSQPGHRTLEREITVVPGVDHAMDLDMVDVPSTFPYRTAGWVSAIAGVAMAGAGIYLVALHGNQVTCDDPERDSTGDCPYVLSTDYAGAALLGAGAAFATMGAFWLYLDRGTPEQPATVNAFGVGYRGRF